MSDVVALVCGQRGHGSARGDQAFDDARTVQLGDDVLDPVPVHPETAEVEHGKADQQQLPRDRSEVAQTLRWCELTDYNRQARSSTDKLLGVPTLP